MVKQLKGILLIYFLLTLTQGQRSNFKVKQEIERICIHISNPIWPTNVILGTKIQTNKAHLMTQVPKVKVTGQGQMSKKWPKSTKWAISPMLFHLQTSYLVPRYNPIRHIRWPWPKVKVKGQGQIFPKMGKNPKNWSYLGGYFTNRLHTWYQGTTQ